jgi:hypothetical protein
MHIIWTIIIGFIAGVIAKFVTPGKNEPSGFILTTILGIAGAFVALKAPLIPVRRWMKKENPTDGVDFAKRLEPARLTFG